MNTNQFAAGTLILMTLALLLALGKLDLLVILLPVSLVLSYGMARVGKKAGLSVGLKKR
jgi:hypothetical protein